MQYLLRYLTSMSGRGGRRVHSLRENWNGRARLLISCLVGL